MTHFSQPAQHELSWMRLKVRIPDELCLWKHMMFSVCLNLVSTCSWRIWHSCTCSWVSVIVCALGAANKKKNDRDVYRSYGHFVCFSRAFRNIWQQSHKDYFSLFYQSICLSDRPSVLLSSFNIFVGIWKRYNYSLEHTCWEKNQFCFFSGHFPTSMFLWFYDEKDLRYM